MSPAERMERYVNDLLASYFWSCSGCHAQMGFAPDALDTLANGSTLEVTCLCGAQRRLRWENLGKREVNVDP